MHGALVDGGLSDHHQVGYLLDLPVNPLVTE